VNLDPAAEKFEYEPSIDIKDLISLEDVMEELQYGPNGGLIYCMEFLMNNIDWLEDEVGSYTDDYLIIDCPGQIELYTHFDIMKRLVEALGRLNIAICGVYLLESVRFILGCWVFVLSVIVFRMVLWRLTYHTFYLYNTL
jgi:GTPase SAR1 family protein